MKENKEANEVSDQAAEVPVEEAAVNTDATGEETAASEEAAAEAKAENTVEPDWKSLYAITLADFDNYKKRAARDREDVYRYAEGDILKDVLPSVDNLALALEKAADKEDQFVKGVQLVYDSLVKALASHGAKPMEELLGKELDPNFHEALATMPNDEFEEGKICNIVKTGWMLNDKLLRAAQVVVSAGKKEEA
jgi:molecular chaperone GrpE